MAVHKVPQDVEADDQFLGPLSFKQFLFMGGALICGYITFILIDRGLWPVAILFAIPTIFSAVLAVPWSKDQPTDVWLAARIRFFLIPHKRIWNQDGMKELVTITAPLRQKAVYSDGLSQTEVRSRFGALASMIDSRGWAVKGGTASNSFATTATLDDSDRLAAATMTAPKTPIDTSADPLDEENSPIARQFDTMIQQAEQQQRSAALDLVEQARNAVQQPRPESTQQSNQQDEDFWFLNQQQQPLDNPSLARFDQQTILSPGSQTTAVPAADDSAVDTTQMDEYLRQQKIRSKMQGRVRHEKVISPAGQNTDGRGAKGRVRRPRSGTQKTGNRPMQSQQQSTTPNKKDPAILELAQNNDLSIETLQRQGHRPQESDGEVTIDLR